MAVLVSSVMALRGLHLFPHTTLFFDAGREKSILAIEEAMSQDRMMMITAQKDAQVEEVTPEDLYPVGTYARIKQIIKLPNGHMRVLAEGVSRAKIMHYVQDQPYFQAEIQTLDNEEVSIADQAYQMAVSEIFNEYVAKTRRVSEEAAQAVEKVKNPGEFADLVANNLLVHFEDRQKVLECFNIQERLKTLLEILTKELEIALLEREISSKVKRRLDKNQREYILREQLRTVREELGEEGQGELDALKKAASTLPLPQELKDKVDKEITRMESMPPGSHEVTVSRTWLDWVLSLPWVKQEEVPIDMAKARKVLERDHYALDKVKERVLEFLAVRKLAGQNLKGPILCLVGPPGVGKTSIARAVAEAMGRKFVRMSLGGVRDEAEIRGHRRTYVGAIPGRILSGMRQAGSTNPLFLLDELDKLGNDWRGDPSSALLEVLDAEQNNTFRDHYLDGPYDLSNVLFFATANTIDTIPRPLLDRIEVIECPGYTQHEKLEIAKRHILPKQKKAHGLESRSLYMGASTIDPLIAGYTRESGVRQLERQMAALCRKAALKIAENGGSVTIAPKDLQSYLGKPRYRHEGQSDGKRAGVVTGLAWTMAGGETLQVEVIRMSGSGKTELTGQLGDVMKESALTAVSYIRSHSKEWGVDTGFYKDSDLHVHIPAGAVPKDGPSAGITMALAMLSCLIDRPIKKDVAMTGEMTLTGRVLPVGGIKEKVLAAHRAGVKTVLLPQDNARDLDEIPDDVRAKIDFKLVEDFKQVALFALAEGA